MEDFSASYSKLVEDPNRNLTLLQGLARSASFEAAHHYDFTLSLAGESDAVAAGQGPLRA